MTSDETSKIINKIKKCLALSGSSNPHEASVALKQAQRLMEIHGISQAAVDLPEIKTANVRSTSVSRPKSYEINLMNLCCKAFGCMMWFQPGNSYGIGSAGIFGLYNFIGPSHQTAVCEYTAAVLLRRLAKARVEFGKSYETHELARLGYARRVKRSEMTKILDGFCIGWVISVSETVRAFAQTKEINAHLKRLVDENTNGGRIKKGRQQTTVNASAYHAGLEKGRGESLQRPMESNDLYKTKYLT